MTAFNIPLHVQAECMTNHNAKKKKKKKIKKPYKKFLKI
jgi:hypothetical protein